MPWATCRPMGARPAGWRASSASWSATACCPRSSSIPPARTVAPSTLVRNSPEGPVVLSATEFHQMSGRAGRRGKDTIGVVALPAASRDEAREGLALIDAEPDPVTSSFSPGYVQVLNLL